MNFVPKDLIYTNLLGDAVPVPQFTRQSDGKPVEAIGEKAPFVQIVDVDGHPISQSRPVPVELSGSNVGYSTEVKPGYARKGDSYLELDTKKVFIFDGTEWVVF